MNVTWWRHLVATKFFHIHQNCKLVLKYAKYTFLLNIKVKNKYHSIKTINIAYIRNAEHSIIKRLFKFHGS